MAALIEIKELLRTLRPELTIRYGVKTIGLFGSIVRSDFTENSDVDIIVDFDRPVGVEFIELADLIEGKLQRMVDLVSRNGMKKKYFDAIEAEIIYV